jgi:hypothetical protein
MVMHHHIQHNLIIENIEKHMITNLTRVIEVKQKLHDIIANKCCNNMVVMILKLPANGGEKMDIQVIWKGIHNGRKLQHTGCNSSHYKISQNQIVFHII